MHLKSYELKMIPLIQYFEKNKKIKKGLFFLFYIIFWLTMP
jgi:hypothetical protein